MTATPQARAIAEEYWCEVPQMAERIRNGWEDENALLIGIGLGIAAMRESAAVVAENWCIDRYAWATSAQYACDSVGAAIRALP